MKFLIVFVFALLISMATFAQDATVADLSKTGELNLLQNQLLRTATPFSQQVVPSGNSVFIQQIGLNNNVNTNVVSSQSQISIFQRGTGNDVTSNYFAQQIDVSVLQNGNYNSFIEFVGNNNANVTSQVIQNGNNLTLEKYGANSISNKLQINMVGNDKTIIINSF